MGHLKKKKASEAERFGKTGRVKAPVLKVKPVISELRAQLAAVDKAIRIFESLAETERRAGAQSAKAAPTRREQTVEVRDVEGSQFLPVRPVGGVQAALHTTALIDFLDADLDLGFTVLQTAAIANHADHIVSALGLVRKSLATVYMFRDRIQDPGAQGAIAARARELEQELRAFEHPEKATAALA